MINIQTELNTLSDALTSVLRDVIKSKGLVDTGKLYDSIQVIPRYTNSKLSLDIEAEDYFEYVDKANGIMDAAMRSSKWDNAIENAMFKIISKEIEDKI